MLRAAGISLLCAGLLFVSRAARAAGPLPANRGDPIATSDYSVDLFQGPTLASARITALGGSYVAIAEGAEGIPFNPAAASWRFPQSTSNVDWDLTGGITLASSIKGIDFDNNGSNTDGKGLQTIGFLSGGGYIQYGHAAVGAMVSAQAFDIPQNPLLEIPQPPSTDPSAPTKKNTGNIEVRFYKLDPVVAYGFLDDQLHVGVGARAIILQMAADLTDVDGKNPGNTQQFDLFTNYAFGVQGGVLWAPYHLPIRLGGAVRSPLAATEGTFEGGFKADANGDIHAGGTYFPKRAVLPWEVEGGASVQLWQRPLNIQWQNEDEVPVADTERWRQTNNDQIEPPYRGARRMLKKRYRELPRQKVLLTTSALLSGKVEDGVGVESMISGRLQRSGQDLSVTIRGGVEAEVIPYWLVLRAGSYLEPSRFRESSSRLHGTGGFQVRIFKWDAFGLADKDTVWRVSTAVDAARDYFAWSVGAGMFM